MSGHEGIKTRAGTTFYFGTKAGAVAQDRAGDTRALISDLAACVDACLNGIPFDVVHLTGRNIAAERLYDVLGEGEIKLWVREPGFVTEVVESVMSGVWRLTRRTESGEPVAEFVDTGDLPRLVNEVLELYTAGELKVPATPDGTMSAGPILQEIGHHMAEDNPHTIVLTNLPLSPVDGNVLNEILGEGPVAGGSKGYSTTRVRSTNYRRVWRTNYMNSDGQVIYDAIEITRAPLSLAAPREDIEEGRRRLADLMKIYA